VRKKKKIASQLLGLLEGKSGSNGRVSLSGNGNLAKVAKKTGAAVLGTACCYAAFAPCAKKHLLRKGETKKGHTKESGPDSSVSPTLHKPD